jgi:thiol-disulfide isomerase/thioredoxin
MFTEDHKEVLAKHRHHYNSLTTLGFMRNVDKPVFDELQKVHNEAIGVVHWSSWCGECVAEMVRIIYVNYDKQVQTEQTTTPTSLKRRGNGK